MRIDWLGLSPGTTNGSTAALTGGQRRADLARAWYYLRRDQRGDHSDGPVQPDGLPASAAVPGDCTVYGFNFDGLTLVTGLDTATGLGRNSALGYSVTPLGDINRDGIDDFAISAPNDAGGGKVFVVYGGRALAAQPTNAKTIDLEPTAGTTSAVTPTKVVSFSIPNAATGTDVGYSVAGIGNYFNTTTGRDLAIGVPGLTVGGNVNAGAAFTVSGSYINSLAAGANVDLTTIGNGTNLTAGIEYTGVNAGDLTGFSVATAGNFDGQNGSFSAIDDLLIGAPGAAFGGQAYLVYAIQSFAANASMGSTYSLASLGQIPTTNPVTNPLEGIVFSSQNAGDDLGYVVASAGDFNSDGVDDVLLGAPGYNTLSGSSTGYAYVAYGLAGTTTTTPTRINGIFSITPTAATSGLTATSFIGQPGDEAGYSVAPTTHIQFGTTPAAQPDDDILIGAPGAITVGGRVYLVPGTASGVAPLTLPQMLSNINLSLNGNVFDVTGTFDPAIVGGVIGTSVSARNPVIDVNTLNTTVDGDNIPDLFFGAPGSGLNNSTLGTNGVRANSGVVYAIQGALIGATSATTTPTTPTTTTTTGLFTPTALSILAPPIFTGDLQGLPYPTVSALSHLISYQPLPVQLAYEQFLPASGFLAREQVSNHPSQKKGSHQAPAGTVLNIAAVARSENPYDKRKILASKVYDRGKFKIGKATTFTHKKKVIPAVEQTESYPG